MNHVMWMDIHLEDLVAGLKDGVPKDQVIKALQIIAGTLLEVWLLVRKNNNFDEKKYNYNISFTRTFCFTWLICSIFFVGQKSLNIGLSCFASPVWYSHLAMRFFGPLLRWLPSHWPAPHLATNGHPQILRQASGLFNWRTGAHPEPSANVQAAQLFEDSSRACCHDKPSSYFLLIPGSVNMEARSVVCSACLFSHYLICIHLSFHFVRASRPATLELVEKVGLSSHVLSDLALLHCLLDLSTCTDSQVQQSLLQTCKYGSFALRQQVNVRMKLALRANMVLRIPSQCSCNLFVCCHSLMHHFWNMFQRCHSHSSCRLCALMQLRMGLLRLIMSCVCCML